MFVSKLNLAVSLCVALSYLFAEGVAAEDLVCLSTTGIGLQSIVGVDTDSPQLPTFVKPITGVEKGTLLNGLDFRASDGQLYTIASPSVVNLEQPITTSQLYHRCGYWHRDAGW